MVAIFRIFRSSDTAQPPAAGNVTGPHSAFDQMLVATKSGTVDAQGRAGLDRPYALNKGLLDEIVRGHMSPEGKGSAIDGIPNTNPNPDERSITVMNARTGEMVSTGNLDHRFSQQSMSKPTAMALAIELMGGEAAYRQHVGVEASGLPYNAPKLLPDGRAFNSSVNAGALMTWVLIHAHTPPGKEPFDLYLDQMKKMTGNPHLTVNEPMAEGEFKFRPPGGGESGNQKLLKVLDEAGQMSVLEKRNGLRPLSDQQKQTFINNAFRDYCRACAVMVNTQDMAKVAAVYRNGGRLVDPKTGVATQVLPEKIANFVHRSNDVSGSYNESGTQFVKNSFGGKTGVDGSIFGSLHGHRDLVVATHHSDLNAAGNSGEGQKWIGTLNKMNLTLQQRAALHLPGLKVLKRFGAKGKIRNLSSGKLGDSPRELDKKLRAEMSKESLEALGKKLREVTEDNKGFYLKDRHRDGKDPLRGAKRLLTTTKDGRVRNYYLAQGTHQLHKVVVSDITDAKQLSVAIPSASLDISSGSFGPNIAVAARKDAPPQNDGSLPREP